MMKTILCRSVWLASAAAMLSTTAIAQSTVQVVSLDIDHPLLGNMIGAAASVPLLPTWLRFGGEFVANSTRRTGGTCVGLTPPNVNCDPESVSDKARMLSVLGEVLVPVVRAQRVDVDMLFNARVAQIQTRRRGFLTGRSIDSNEGMYGGYLGIETTWYPAPAKPLGVRISGAAGRMEPFNSEGCADCADPIREGANLVRFALGVSWRHRQPSR